MGVAASLFLGWVAPAAADTPGESVGAAVRLFLGGQGLKARAELSAIADAARDDPALRARALATLLEVCRRPSGPGRPGSGPAAALAQAQRDYLAAPPTRAHLHPRFWAPFIILGDGGPS